MAERSLSAYRACVAAVSLLAAACSEEPKTAPTTEASADAAVRYALVEEGTVALERGACFGPCPVYSVTVFANDRLVFEGRKFTAKAGALEKILPAGSFERLLAVARQYNFADIDTGFPDEEGLDCPEPPSDMPVARLAIDATGLAHEIRFYEGCTGFPGDSAVISMMREVDAVLALDDWIGARADYLGGRK
jgi:hypothetical protein